MKVATLEIGMPYQNDRKVLVVRSKNEFFIARLVRVAGRENKVEEKFFFLKTGETINAHEQKCSNIVI